MEKINPRSESTSTIELIKTIRLLEINADRPRYNDKKTKESIPLVGMFKALSYVNLEAPTTLDTYGNHGYKFRGSYDPFYHTKATWQAQGLLHLGSTKYP